MELEDRMVCHYCSNQVIGPLLGPEWYACSLQSQEGGKYRHIALNRHMLGDCIDGTAGCEKFEASGLPATSEYKAEMVRRNPKAESIPVDEGAFNRDMLIKMLDCPHVKWRPVDL